MDAAIVTGVSRGLGAALVRLLLARGWNVVGVGRQAAQEAADGRFRLVRCDLAETASIRSAVAPMLQQIARRRPARVVLVNNAAVAAPVGLFGTLDDRDIETGLEVNLVAPSILCNLFVEVFLDAACPRRIVNVSSGAAQSALVAGGMYSVAKAGLEMLTQSIAAESAHTGIVAISLRPGIVDTDMQLFMRSQSEERVPSVGLFRDFHSSGQLVAPHVAAERIVTRLIEGEVENGRMYRYAEL